MAFQRPNQYLPAFDSVRSTGFLKQIYKPSTLAFLHELHYRHMIGFSTYLRKLGKSAGGVVCACEGAEVHNGIILREQAAATGARLLVELRCDGHRPACARAPS